MNTTQINRLETNLSNLKMVGFTTIEEYISKFNNMKANILTSNGNGKMDPNYINIVPYNLSSTFKTWLSFFMTFLFLFQNLIPLLWKTFYCNSC
jgi:hypothetical protein